MGSPMAMARNFVPNNHNTRATSKDAIKDKGEKPTVTEKEHRHGGSWNKPKLDGPGVLNQRQYRKKCASNPHLYRSFKHRSKN
jgi:hypothetical protein